MRPLYPTTGNSFILGRVFDEYPSGDAANRNFYDRVMRGEKVVE